jgi:hypothetical protein
MNFKADETRVVQEFGRGEKNVIAMCFNTSWAAVIAELLQKDWEDAK